MRLLIPTIFFLFSQVSAEALEFTFATPEEAAAILTADDNYFERMSPAEIAIRMESETTDKTAADLRAQYAANVRAWSDEEKAKFGPNIEAARQTLEAVAGLLPETIYLIRTTNKVEGGLPHTRGGAIIIPDNNTEIPVGLLYHEAFHVLSRRQAAKHQSLYGLIGFSECRLDEPDAVASIHLTNPDVPALAYYLPAADGEGTMDVIPFLYAAYPAFNPEAEHGFPGHFGFGLLKVGVKAGVCEPVLADGAPVFLDPSAVPEFFQAIGKNTGYIIHPEEVLADNFTLLMEGKEGLPNPEILERLEGWLTAGE